MACHYCYAMFGHKPKCPTNKTSGKKRDAAVAPTAGTARQTPPSAGPSDGRHARAEQVCSDARFDQRQSARRVVEAQKHVPSPAPPNPEQDHDCACCCATFPFKDLWPCNHSSHSHLLCEHCITSIVTTEFNKRIFHYPCPYKETGEAQCYREKLPAALEARVGAAGIKAFYDQHSEYLACHEALCRHAEEFPDDDGFFECDNGHWTCRACKSQGLVTRNGHPPKYCNNEDCWQKKPAERNETADERMKRLMGDATMLYCINRDCSNYKRRAMVKALPEAEEDATAVNGADDGQGCNGLTCGECKTTYCYLCHEEKDDEHCDEGRMCEDAMGLGAEDWARTINIREFQARLVRQRLDSTNTYRLSQPSGHWYSEAQTGSWRTGYNGRHVERMVRRYHYYRQDWFDSTGNWRMYSQIYADPFYSEQVERFRSARSQSGQPNRTNGNVQPFGSFDQDPNRAAQNARPTAFQPAPSSGPGPNPFATNVLRPSNPDLPYGYPQQHPTNRQGPTQTPYHHQAMPQQRHPIYPGSAQRMPLRPNPAPHSSPMPSITQMRQFRGMAAATNYVLSDEIARLFSCRPKLFTTRLGWDIHEIGGDLLCVSVKHDARSNRLICQRTSDEQKHFVQRWKAERDVLRR